MSFGNLYILTTEGQSQATEISLCLSQQSLLLVDTPLVERMLIEFSYYCCFS